MILPLRVRGRVDRNAISFGATAAPRRLRAWPSSSSAATRSRESRLERDEGLHHLAGHRIGLADDPGFGNGRMLHQDALSTSNGPIRCPADLITSSARPTNQK
jgi:hypothetical protein